MLSSLEIKDLIPHRNSMLLVDRIIEFDRESKKIMAVRKIHGNEFFLDGHYPGFPIVPGVITCECLFQTGAALISALKESPTSDGKVPVISRIGKTKFKGMIRPGDEIHLKVSIVDDMGAAIYLKGSAEVDGKVKATVEFTVMETQ